jgi:hypothetical protein
MGSNRAKFSSGPRKWQGSLKSENNSSDVAILNRAVDPLFHRGTPPCPLSMGRSNFK